MSESNYIYTPERGRSRLSEARLPLITRRSISISRAALRLLLLLSALLLVALALLLLPDRALGITASILC